MSNCHSMLDSLKIQGGCIALVGNPNVGKSILFHRLTGKYVVVSNYPGTTVELTQGALRAVKGITLLDTPGIINLPSRSEDEQVTERVLFQGGLQAVVQVGDAKNIRRTLHLTIWLAEMNLPLVLALNMMDEASSRGLNINIERLKEKLSIPVVKTIATRGTGISDLEEAVRRAETPRIRIEYPEQIERALEECEPYLPAGAISSRALGLLWLCEDVVSEQYVKEKLNPQTIQILMGIRRALQNRLEDSPTVIIQQARERYVDQLADLALEEGKHRKLGLGDLLGRLSVHPVWGIPVLGLVLYGMYWFVGVFGAGTLVGLIEEDFFGGIINPWLISLAERFIPWPLARDLLVGDYGLWSMGLTYALALLLPIVFTFFIAFGVLEDSGYLPRLAVLTNRLFSAIGLNGQAVLPMVLGLGCVTMATMTTRILTRP
ncbi:MAG: ferrous iron transporter B, partial [Chloroflexota bacterium]